MKNVQPPYVGRCKTRNPDYHLKFQQVYFVVDTDYRLLWIGGEWDEFALSNAGEKARSNEVLSTSLLTHIADDATRKVTRDLIETVVDMQEPLRIDYRCDSPAMLRRFQMTVQPMREQRVLVVHDLRDARSFTPPLTPWTIDPQAPDQKCTFCHSVRMEGADWVDVEHLADPHPERVAFTVCQPCQSLIDQAVSDLRAKRKQSNSLSSGFGPGETQD